MGPIFIHADPRIPRSEVDFVAEKMVLSGKDWEGLNKFFIGDPETGWERVYALKKIGDGRYSMTFTIGSSRSELLAGPDELGAPRVFSLTRYRMQQVLGFRARVLDPTCPRIGSPTSCAGFFPACTRWWFSMKSTRTIISAVISRR
jgi:hypothetical protein